MTDRERDHRRRAVAKAKKYLDLFGDPLPVDLMLQCEAFEGQTADEGDIDLADEEDWPWWIR